MRRQPTAVPLDLRPHPNAMVLCWMLATIGCCITISVGTKAAQYLASGRAVKRPCALILDFLSRKVLKQGTLPPRLSGNAYGNGFRQLCTAVMFRMNGMPRAQGCAGAASFKLVQCLRMLRPEPAMNWFMYVLPGVQN